MRSAFLFAAVAMLLAGCGSKTSNQRTVDGAADGPGADLGQAPGGADGSDATSPGDGAAGDVAADGEAGAADPFGRAVESFCKQKALKVCAQLVACSYQAVSEAACRAKTESDCRGEIDTSAARSAAAGRLTIDEAAFARCLAAYDRIQCAGAFNEVPPQCVRLFKGKIADGQPCLNRHECAGGMCRRTDTCPGTCASYGMIGADCGLPGTGACDPLTSFCDRVTHKCAAPAAAGSTCPGSLDLSCVDGDFCENATNSPCNTSASMPQNCRCTPLRGLGMACNDSAQCQPGFVCAGSKCHAPSKMGESCDLSVNVYCEPGLACIPTVTDAGAGVIGTCGPRVPEGSKCVSECQLGLVCVPDDPDAGAPPGTCRAPGKLGQACHPEAGCAEGLGCGVTGKCEALPPCTDASCPGGLPVRAPCSISTNCASFVCLQRMCVAACSTADL